MSPRRSDVHPKDGSDSSLRTQWSPLVNVAIDESAAIVGASEDGSATSRPTRWGLVSALFPMGRQRPEVRPSDGSARSLPTRWTLVRYIVGNESATGRICVRGTAPPRCCRRDGYRRAMSPCRSDGLLRLVASDAILILNVASDESATVGDVPEGQFRIVPVDALDTGPERCQPRVRDGWIRVRGMPPTPYRRRRRDWCGELKRTTSDISPESSRRRKSHEQRPSSWTSALTEHCHRRQRPKTAPATSPDSSLR